MTDAELRAERLAWRRPGEAARLIACGVTLRVSGRVALLVGTVLTVVNQGGALTAGDQDTGLILRTVANYVTPFLVSSVSLLLPYRREITSAAPPNGKTA